MNNIDQLVDEIVKRIKPEVNTVEVEASGRHIHLDRPTIDALFGEGYQLTKAKDLSQPGQYACKERITIASGKNSFQNVVILGPERPAAQVEVSATDATSLGLRVPVRESGDIEGTPGIVLINGTQSFILKTGVIVAKRHIHITEEDARRFNVSKGEIVQVKIEGARALIFDDVVIRVSADYATSMHIDYDEANAVGFKKGIRGEIIKKSEK